MGNYTERLKTPGRTIFGRQCNKDGTYAGLPAVPAKKIFMAGFRAAASYYRRHPDQLLGDEYANRKPDPERGK